MSALLLYLVTALSVKFIHRKAADENYNIMEVASLVQRRAVKHGIAQSLAKTGVSLFIIAVAAFITSSLCSRL